MEPALHFAIPFTVITLGARRARYAFVAGLFGILPDFDVFLGIDRSVSHSFIPGILLVIVYLALAMRFRKRIPFLVFAGFGLVLHSSLDLLGGYTPILWPIYPNELLLSIDVRMQFSSSPFLYLTYSLMERPYNLSSYEFLDSPVATAEGVLISALLVISALLSLRRVRPS